MRGFLHLGGNPGAPKGEEWILEKDCPEFGWGLGAGQEDEDSTMRE